MTNQPDKADDLIAEILEIVSDGDQFGERAKHPTTIKTRNALEKAAATIKELKAKTEILQGLVSGGLYSKRKAAEDRAAKAEEALREIRKMPSGFVHDNMQKARSIAREALGEEKA